MHAVTRQWHADLSLEGASSVVMGGFDLFLDLR
jgi:hypothetical protein